MQNIAARARQRTSPARRQDSRARPGSVAATGNRTEKREADHCGQPGTCAQAHIAKQAEVTIGSASSAPIPPDRSSPLPPTTVPSRIQCDANQSTSCPRSSTTCSDVRPIVSRPIPPQSILRKPTLQIRRVMDERTDHQDTGDRERHVDVKDPAPSPIIDQPSAEAPDPASGQALPPC